jgi:hypothetical protein
VTPPTPATTPPPSPAGHPTHGLGDPRIPWVVLLDVEAASPPDAPSVSAALDALARETGWPRPSPAAVVTGERRQLLGALSADASEVVRVGLHDGGLVVAARHDALDGLALLAVAGRLLGSDLLSSARGVGDGRRRVGGAGALVARAWEVAARPPARVAAAHSTLEGAAPVDAFAEATVEGSPRTADLVHAGARAISAWNAARDVSSRRLSVAVGVSTVGGAAAELADRSAFLRLRGVERLGLDEVRARLADAPLQPGGAGSGAGPAALGGVARLAVRLAAPRLGSTLLVSHLGTLDVPDSVDDIGFYPVTGGGSGLSLGAATARGRTTLTLRGRAATHDDEGQRQLLALVVEALGPTSPQ